MDSRLFDLPQSEPADQYYALMILTVTDHAPLLASPRLARLALAQLAACAPYAPGTLWGAVVLPTAIRLVIGPGDDVALGDFVDRVKAQTATCLLAAIRRADDSSLDYVLRYSPVWGGVILQVWQAGAHRQVFWTEYRLSNALFELFQAPVEAGLVDQADDWPYRYTPPVGV